MPKRISESDVKIVIYISSLLFRKKTAFQLFICSIAFVKCVSEKIAPNKQHETAYFFVRYKLSPREINIHCCIVYYALCQSFNWSFYKCQT